MSGHVGVGGTMSAGGRRICPASLVGQGRASPEISVRRGRRVLSVGETPTRQLSFQPVAIGTVVEVTKRLRLPVQRVLQGLGEHAGGNEQ